MSKLTIISGSPAEQTRLNGVLAEILKQSERENINPEIIQIRELPPQDLIHAKFDSEEIIKTNQIIEKSSVIIILTPVYKASLYRCFKNLSGSAPAKWSGREDHSACCHWWNIWTSPND